MKETLRASLEATITTLCDSGQLGSLRILAERVVLDSSRRAEQGDYSSGICLKLASVARLSAQEIGEIVLAKLRDDIGTLCSIQLAPPGFLNFKLTQPALLQILKRIHKARNSKPCAAQLRSARQALCLLSNRDHLDQQFYSQYTLVYCFRMLERTQQPVLEQEPEPSRVLPLDELTWSEWLVQFQNDETTFAAVFLDSESFASARKLVIALDEADNLLALRPYARLSFDCRRKAYELALALHELVSFAPLFSDDAALLQARLGIVYATAVLLERLIENSMH